MLADLCCSNDPFRSFHIKQSPEKWHWQEHNNQRVNIFCILSMNQYLKPDINEYFNDLGPILNDIFITIFCIIQKMIFLFIRTYFSFDTTDQGIPSVLVFQTGSPNRKFQPEVLVRVKNREFLNWMSLWGIRQRHYQLVCLQCTTSSQWGKL